MLEKVNKLMSSQTLKILQEKQQELDTFIHQQNKMKLSDTLYLRKIALFVEIGEVANELQTFKYWKREKKIDYEKVKLELIDCLHFFLSLANNCQVDFTNYRFQQFNLHQKFDTNKLLLSLFERTKKLSFPRKKTEELKNPRTNKDYFNWLRTFEKLSWQAGINEEILLEVYSKKNKINHQRQLKNY